MIVEQIATGGDRNFGYIVADESSGAAIVIDPSYSPRKIYQVILEKGYDVKYILNTHRHHDHSNGNEEMRHLTGVRALAHGDIDPVTGTKIQDGAHLPFGQLEAEIIHTPGHTADSICILAGDALFTGDTLFVGKVGGTDFGDGARAEFESLHHKLLILPDETRVFPDMMWE